MVPITSPVHVSFPLAHSQVRRNLDADTPMRFTTRSCKRQYHDYRARSGSTEQPWRSHSNAICAGRVAKHNRTMRSGQQKPAPKPDRISTPKRKNFKRFLKGNHQRQNGIHLFATSLQPLENDLRFSAAKDNSTTRAAVAARSLYAATPLRSADTELQSTIELRAEATQIAAPKPDGSRRQSEKKQRFNLKRFQKEFYKERT